MATEAEDTIRAFLSMMGGSSPLARRNVRRMPTYVDFLLEHGRLWAPASLANGVPRGKKKECFRNAFRLATQRPGLTYVEGIALAPFDGIPIEHAWCVDDTGRVVDSTWDDPMFASYYGVAIDSVTLCKIAQATKVYGVFNFMTWQEAARIFAEHPQFSTCLSVAA